MYLDDCVCVLPDLTWLPLLGAGRKSWYIIIVLIQIISHRFVAYSLKTWYLSNMAIGHLLIGWLGIVCVCARVLAAQTVGVYLCFLPHAASFSHAKCCGPHSQTIRLYAHTYNMTPSVSYVSPVTRWRVQFYCAYKYYVNFITHFIFITECWHDFF